MFNLKKRHQELTALHDELCDIRVELWQAKRYYQNHPEDHTYFFGDTPAAPQRLQQVEALIAKVDARFWSVNSELTDKKYKKFKRK